MTEGATVYGGAQIQNEKKRKDKRKEVGKWWKGMSSNEG